MLLIIIPAVCKESGSPFGDPDVCNDHGVAYASLSMAVCVLVAHYQKLLFILNSMQYLSILMIDSIGWSCVFVVLCLQPSTNVCQRF